MGILFAVALLLTIALEVPIVSALTQWRVGRHAVLRAAITSAGASAVTLPALWWLQLRLASSPWPTTPLLECGVAIIESGILYLLGGLRPRVALAAGISSNLFSWAAGAALFAWLWPAAEVWGR